MREHTSRLNSSPKRKACPECSKKFETSRPEQRFCSESCRSKNYRTHNREKIRAIWKRDHPRKQPEVKVCAQCGKDFESSLSWQKFCSVKCRSTNHYVRHRARYAAYTRNYRKDHPEKAKQACRRYYRKHRATQNAYTKARYAEKKRKLAEAEAKAERLREQLAEAVAAAQADVTRIAKEMTQLTQSPSAAQAETPRIGRPPNAELARRVRELRAGPRPASWARVKLTLDRETGEQRALSTYRWYAGNS